MNNELRKLPSVDKLLRQDELIALIERYGRQLVVEAVRGEADHARQQVLAGEPAPSAERLTTQAVSRLAKITQPTLQQVMNATGVVIHTNLGRAILSQRAIQAMQQAASSYSNLEYDLAKGKRGSRYIHAADLLCRLTGAEAALVVNNNASAVILSLTALAQGAEVIINRSELVEIGGGFRIPDIMRQSGATLVEVGTTNRTYGRDFEHAIVAERTGLLLSVHSSNYQVIGFTAKPSLAELAEIAQRHHIPLMEDLGSGTLLDTAVYGLAHEPTIQESVTAGVDLITASGDKLLGGPQAGLILGRASLIEKIKKHPLTRAFRVDKTTLAALQATLLAYLEDRAVAEIPVWRMISMDLATLSRRARRWRNALRRHENLSHVPINVIDAFSTVGGGSLPGQTLPTKALAIQLSNPDRVAEALRQTAPPIIVRIENDLLLLDPRTVLPEQEKTLLNTLAEVLGASV